MEDEPEFIDPAQKLVLVVDDDEGQLDLLKLLVGKEGFRIEHASSGSEALKKAAAVSPDLIVLDLMLPGLGGYEVLRQLQSEGMGSIPVLVISAKTMDAKTIDNLKQESNVRDFVPKPPQPRMFAAKLHSLLGTRQRVAES